MNIWSWVHDTENRLREEGQERLAEIMDDISSHTCNDEHDKVDALYAEGLTLARQHPNKWIEVFLRHWYLQSQVLHRYNTRGNLSEAIDLLEFSHRDDTRDCPQSVCVVQDVANCYGLRDGAGFFQERVDVCNETLARIDPTWPCYDCIGGELVSAYRDAGMYPQALEKMRWLRAQMLKHGRRPDVYLQIQAIECHLSLGHLEQAEKLARAALNNGGGASFVTKRSLLLALILTEQGRFDEAQEIMLPFDAIAKTASRYKNWCTATANFARHDPERNNHQLDYDFAFLFERAHENGAVRLALEIAIQRAELALLRDDIYGAQRALEQAERATVELNKDMGARADIDNVAAKIDAKIEQRQNQVNPATLENLTGPESEHPDVDLFDIARLHAANSDHAELTIAYGDALNRRGFYDQCSELYQAFLDRQPNDIVMLARYGHSLLDRHAFQQFDERFGSIESGSLHNDDAKAFHWVSARRWHHAEPPTAVAHLESILAIDPDANAARSKAALLHQNLGHYDSALTHLDYLLAAEGDVKNVHWDRLVCATLAERWDLVRESSAALDMELSGEDGPVEEDWGVIRIRFRDDNDELISLRARRTGPVTASILDLSRFGDTQYYDHQIVFDACPQNTLDQKDDEGHLHDAEGYYTYLYDAVRRIPGPDYFYFTLDGVYPSDEQWQALEQAFYEQPGLLISRRSSEDYTLSHPESGEELMGIYAIAGVGEQCPLRDVHLMLENLTADFEHPLIWPHLASELGDEATLKRQAEIEQRYGLE